MAYEVKVLGHNRVLNHGMEWRCEVTMPDGRKKIYTSIGNKDSATAAIDCELQARSDVEVGRYTPEVREPGGAGSGGGGGGTGGESGEPRGPVGPRGR